MTIYPRPFDIGTHLEAFLQAENSPWETVLSPTQAPKASMDLKDLKGPRDSTDSKASTNLRALMDPGALVDHFPIAQDYQQTLSSKGVYIAIGGLGGLGRYVCRWMVDHGATHILAISRRGISSSKAQQLYNFINDSGNTLHVFKADACDRKAIRLPERTC